jgi:hypothetical protein
VLAGWLLLVALASAENKPSPLVLAVEETSSGPFGGQKSRSCLRVYSDGRMVFASWSTSPVDIEDENGKVTRPEKTYARAYQFPERDSWEISSFIEFLESKPVRRLKSYFPPPHTAIDYFETTTVRWTPKNGKEKQVQTREYYVASLIEKTKYPAALIILMGKIEELENTVHEKGTDVEVPSDCKLQQAVGSRR